MKNILAFLHKLFAIRDESAYDEEYLAQAVDLYDLESRIRELDQRRYRSNSMRMVGLY